VGWRTQCRGCRVRTGLRLDGRGNTDQPVLSCRNSLELCLHEARWHSGRSRLGHRGDLPKRRLRHVQFHARLRLYQLRGRGGKRHSLQPRCASAYRCQANSAGKPIEERTGAAKTKVQPLLQGHKSRPSPNSRAGFLAIEMLTQKSLNDSAFGRTQPR